MTTSLGTWGDPDQIVFRPFRFYGQTFHARGPSIPVLRGMKRRAREMQAAVEEGTLDVDSLDAVVDIHAGFVGACLTPAERDRWDALLADENVEIQLADLKELSSTIAGMEGRDPLDNVPNGSTPNGATSGASSTSPGYTTDPIPTS